MKNVIGTFTGKWQRHEASSVTRFNDDRFFDQPSTCAARASSTHARGAAVERPIIDAGCVGVAILKAILLNGAGRRIITADCFMYRTAHNGGRAFVDE